MFSATPSIGSGRRAAMERFFSQYPCLPQDQYPETVSGSTAGERPLTLRLDRQLFFPRFQFTNSAPDLDPAMATIVKALREGGMSDWEVAFWLTTPNTYLQGKRPLDCLQQVPRLLLAIQWELDDGQYQ